MARPNSHRPTDRQPAPLFAQEGPTFYDQEQDTDYREPPKRRRGGRGKKRRKKRSAGDVLYTIAILIFAAIFLVSGGLLLKRFIDDRKLESDMNELAGLIDDTAAPTGDGETPETNEAKFARLLERNPDFIGWISSEGTNLDYPVMQTGSDRQDYYLRRNFNGEYDNYGTPYLDEDCTLTAEYQSNNLVIYGHNMKTGTVFGSLTGYKEASYYDEHPTIAFDSLYGDGVYEVFAAFPIDINVDTTFPYNTYIDMDEQQFNDFISQVKSRSTVDSGITPVYGDQLLTLSTCEYSVGDGRFVVCARKVQQ